MASEADELRLTVTLVDNASEGVKKIEQSLKSLSGGQNAVAFQQMRKHTEDLQRQIRPLGDDFKKAGESIVPFIRGVGGAATGMLAFGYAAEKGLDALAKYSSELVRLNQLSIQTGTGAATIKSMREQMEQWGLTAGQIARNTTGLAESMHQMTLVMSPMRQKLLEGLRGEPLQAMQDFLAESKRLAESGDMIAYANHAEEGLAKITKSMEAAGLSPQRIAERRKQFGEIFGAPDLNILQKFQAVSAEEEKAQKARDEAAQKYLALTTKIGQEWKKVTDAWFNQAITSSPLMESMKWIDEKMEAYVKNLAEVEKINKEHPTASGWQHFNPFNQQNIENQKALGFDTESPLMKWWKGKTATPDKGDNLEVPHMQHGGIVSRATLAMIGEGGPEAVIPLGALGKSSEDLSKEMKENTDQLKQLNDALRGVILPGGGGVGGVGGGVGGAGAGPGAIMRSITGGGMGGLGGMMRGLGGLPGFGGRGAPNGSDVGPGTGNGAGETPSEPYTPQKGDIEGSGGPGGRFNVPAGTPISPPSERESVTLSNGQKVTVNKRAAPQFRGFFNDLIKAGAPVSGLGGFGTRGNPSQHPTGMAVDWAQNSRDVVSPRVADWISKNRGTLSNLENRWGLSGGENWRHPDTGHFSIEHLYGSEHLAKAAGGDSAVTANGSDVGPGTGKGAGEATAAGGNAAIANERARVMKQLQEPGMRDLTARVIAHEQAGGAGRADVLESLVNRSVVTGKHPRDLINSGFYGPVNRGEIGTKAPAWALKDYDAASAAVGAGRNALGGRTDQGMINEVKPGGRVGVRGEYYGWMGLPGEQRTAAAQANRADVDRQMTEHRVVGTGQLDVNVNAPKNTFAKASGGGLFKKVAMNRRTQMEPAATSLGEE
jgi:hypothetical protein